MSGDDGFLARWSRRKTQALRHEPLPAEPAAVPVPAPAVVPLAEPPAARPAAPSPDAAAPSEPPPTMDDVRGLTPEADFSRFVRRDVEPGVQQAALKTLFRDPRFNVMDGLDTYIDDYGRPDPLPESMLRRMTQSVALGLFSDAPSPAAPDPQAEAVADAVTAAAPAPAGSLPDEDPDLRLQPDDAAGRAEAGAGPGEDAGREP